MGSIEKDMNTKFHDPRFRAMSNIIFTGAWIKGNMESVLKPYNLTSPQFNILRILRGANDWLSMAEVRNRMVEKSPNATRLCDKLEEKGLIIRDRISEDKRQVFLKISETGLKFIAPLDNPENRKKMDFVENITPEEANQLSDILDKLRG